MSISDSADTGFPSPPPTGPPMTTTLTLTFSDSFPSPAALIWQHLFSFLFKSLCCLFFHNIFRHNPAGTLYTASMRKWTTVHGTQQHTVAQSAAVRPATSPFLLWRVSQWFIIFFTEIVVSVRSNGCRRCTVEESVGPVIAGDLILTEKRVKIEG